MGGKAFEGVTRRITKAEVSSTIGWLMEAWPNWSKNSGLTLHQSLLGSAGKNPDSGDIDLNLDTTVYDQAEVASQLTELLGDQYVKARPGNNQIFTAIPISGDAEAHGRVQIDFMFGDYEWQKFSYHSPMLDPNRAQSRYHWRHQSSDTSVLKGLYRTEYLKAITAYNSDWILEEGGEVIARVGPTFFHDRGCVWRYRHRPMRQDGTARVQDFKELTRDEFKEIYPSSLDARTDVIIDPKELVHMLFQENVAVGDVMSFEDVAIAVTRNYNVQEQAVIHRIYLERLNNLKVEIPTTVFARSGIKVK